MPLHTPQSVRAKLTVGFGFSILLFFAEGTMLQFQRRHYADGVRKPSAIDGLLAQGQISKLTADEYRVLARQARTALAPRATNGKPNASRR